MRFHFIEKNRTTRSFFLTRFLLLFAGFLAASGPFCLAAPEQEDPEESDFPPGLLAVYRTAQTKIERLDPQVSFDWGSDSPDVRLAAGPFEANWTGLFLVKGDGKHRFHAYLQGEVKLLLNGKTVLEGSSGKPKWISGKDVELEFGEQEIEVRYKKTGNGAVIKLFWSSDRFAIEPITTHLLFRETGRPDLALLERGRLEFKARRCDRCHLSANVVTSLSAPSLEKVSTGLSGDWIVQKLTRQAGKHDRMPEFQLDDQQARDIAAYLQSASTKKVELPKLNSKKPQEDRQQGELLVRSLGCLACHVVNDLGTSDLFGGGELSQVGSKRSAEWLLQWIRKPERLNAHHRMPTFSLSGKEQRQIAVYLSELKDAKVGKSFGQDQPTSKQIANGKELITKLNCAACHQIPGVKANSENIPLKGNSASRGCFRVSNKNRTSHQPLFRQANEKSLEAWINNLPKNWAELARQPHTFQDGADLLLEKNCLACHSRDRQPGNVAIAGKVAQADSRLKGQSQGLIPPHLTAVGDRLQDAALIEAISGQQKKRRLPWLYVRMPRFQHTESEIAQLKKHLIGQDRLPDGIPDNRLQLVDSGVSQTEEFLIGRELTGGRAFNCIACHKIGSYEPRNTALGTRGSDLLGMAGRLRTAYFLRWVRDPLRIVPGMEMPSYHTAKPGFLGGDLSKQLSTLWRVLNNPKFKAPSNPTVVEQYLVVQPGQSPQIVRDVFELQGTKKRTFVSRPMAVGFDNGHSLLFDLDACAIRGWAFGDFAYQKTEGKSWFWYLAGTPVVAGFSQPSDFVLQNASMPEKKPLVPVMQGARRARLLDYSINKRQVELRYLLTFDFPTGRKNVTISETWKPVRAKRTGHLTGWQRYIRATGIPKEHRFQLNQQASSETLGDPIVKADGISLPLIRSTDIRIDFHKSGQGTQELSATYLAKMGKRATEPFAGKPEVENRPEKLAGTPGFTAVRLPLTTSIMPTSITWDQSGDLIFTDLKGRLFRATDSSRDGVEDKLQLIQQGLSSPFGVTMDCGDILVAHKPEVLRLKENGFCSVLVDGWGHDDNYHDWVSGFAYDASGKMYIGTGSNYSQKGRPKETSKWRGSVLRIEGDHKATLVARGLRYPIGIANDPQGRIFTSDQQGVQNCFNEINHIVPGRAYGVVGLYDPPQPETRAAIQLPHPWTRSVNGIFFIPDREGLRGLAPFRGHGIGCEYNNRFLVRFSFQEVDGELQGACYELTESAVNMPLDAPVFLGPICGAVSPVGNIYIGNIHDSGWLGGQNTGEINCLTPAEKMPNGIREVRAFSNGFEIELLEPISQESLQSKDAYVLSGYTRIWEGSYESPISGRYRPEIKKVEVLQNGKIVRLTVDQLKPSFVYDIHLKTKEKLFPHTAYYTMNRIPK